MDDHALLAEQMAYYKAGAAECDRPYAEPDGPRALLADADDLPIRGDVLELACGTGQWTPLLAARARSVTAVDAAAEVLAIARTRVLSPKVRFVQADLFEWRPPRRYDTVFFAFRLSHVPPARLPGFWKAVAAARSRPAAERSSSTTVPPWPRKRRSSLIGPSLRQCVGSTTVAGTAS
ncbi:class I SAM-dependent methyltransferase [Streptomyces sp. NPDC050610]|uniref:class I SAM-dependent methyltransferase n=1 Tax=Streptomyces sp. NPDC050610 TaxID=3157097 RepID=UPI0034425AF0